MSEQTLLHEMTVRYPQTEFWNDSCEVTSLARAIEQGATGATSNPVIVLQAMQADLPKWEAYTRVLFEALPDADDEAIAWELIEHAVGLGADLLRPVFEQTDGKRGRLSVQVNPRYANDAEAMVEQAIGLSLIRGNIAIKIPATAAGLHAIEYLTSVGVTINATVSYTVPQVIAVAEAVERGIAYAESVGRDVSHVTPWATLMVGRLEDHLKDQARETGRGLPDDLFRMGSVAVFKRAYVLFKYRKFRTRLLAAAMRGHEHWSEFIGGRLVITIPPKTQDEFNASGVSVTPRIAVTPPAAVVETLSEFFPDFRRAYGSDPMEPEEFEHYGASQKTLRQFNQGYDNLLAFVADIRKNG